MILRKFQLGICLKFNQCIKPCEIRNVRKSNFCVNKVFQSAEFNDQQLNKNTSLVIDKLQANFQKKFERKNEKVTPIIRVGFILPVKPKVRHLKAAAEDDRLNDQIKEMIKRNNLNKAMDLLREFALENRFPRRNTLGVLASLCSRCGDRQGISVVREICEVAFPAECEWQMQFRHYEAEALWRTGFYEDALSLFYKLYVNRPLNRRKITNLSTFCIRHMMNEGNPDNYPKVLKFIDDLTKLDNLQPAANLWKLTFCSDSFEVQKISEQLLELYPKLTDILTLKVTAIIEEAKSNFNINLFQRLMTFAIRFKWKHLDSKIFGEYIDYLCSINDVKGVTTSLQYISEFSIIIPAATMEKSLVLLSNNNKIQLPHSLQKLINSQKNGNPPIPANKFQF